MHDTCTVGTVAKPVAEQHASVINMLRLHCGSKYINYTHPFFLFPLLICHIYACREKDTGDVTASEAEHMDDEPVKYSSTESSFG